MLVSVCEAPTGVIQITSWRAVGVLVYSEWACIEHALAKVVLWVGIILSILFGLWPYLSLHPVKSWYALTHEVPVDRVEVEKSPHDCEFLTAPVGEKHCHYDAKVFSLSTGTHLNATVGAGARLL